MKKTLCSAFAAATLCCHTAHAGVIAHYSFDTANALGADTTGVHNASTVNNVTSVQSGVSGRNAHFNGIDSFISINDPGSLSTPDWTISFWVKPDLYPESTPAPGSGTYNVTGIVRKDESNTPGQE